MSEPKPPIVALREAAGALHRELAGLAMDPDPRIRYVEALRLAAGNLVLLAADLEWLGYHKCIHGPLKRTAVALAELSPADVDDDDSAMSATADALEAAGEALHECPADAEKLDCLEASLGRFQPAKESLRSSLTKIAEALRTEASVDAIEAPRNAMNCAAIEIQKMLAAVEKARKEQP